jgi:hypothetical protein
MVGVGAVFTAVGLGVAGTAHVGPAAATDAAHAQQLVGGVIVLAGWALLAWGIHRFGRESRGPTL